MLGRQTSAYASAVAVRCVADVSVAGDLAPVTSFDTQKKAGVPARFSGVLKIIISGYCRLGQNFEDPREDVAV